MLTISRPYSNIVYREYNGYGEHIPFFPTNRRKNNYSVYTEGQRAPKSRTHAGLGAAGYHTRYEYAHMLHISRLFTSPPSGTPCGTARRCAGESGSRASMRLLAAIVGVRNIGIASRMTRFRCSERLLTAW